MAKTKTRQKPTTKPIKVSQKSAVTPQVASKTQRTKDYLKRNKTKFAVAALLSVLLVFIALLYYQQKQTERLLKSPDNAHEESSRRLIDQIGKHVLLPKDEKPTVATVSDVSKLAKQPFFADAQNSDRVLVYTKARKVVLYRPASDRIISFSSLNLEQKSLPESSQPTQPLPGTSIPKQ